MILIDYAVQVYIGFIEQNLSNFSGPYIDLTIWSDGFKMSCGKNY